MKNRFTLHSTLAGCALIRGNSMDSEYVRTIVVAFCFLESDNREEKIRSY